MKLRPADGDAALKNRTGSPFCWLLTRRPRGTDSGERERKESDMETDLPSAARQGYRVTKPFFIISLCYTFTSLSAEPPFEGIVPAEHHVVDFRELSAPHFKEPVPFNL